MLYGRQEILAASPSFNVHANGSVIEIGILEVSELSVHSSSYTTLFSRQCLLQIAWVLYGQASRAISMG